LEEPVMVPMTAARLKERGESLSAFERLGGRAGRLVWLDEQVRAGRRTDWPGRGAGPELRNGIPDLDLDPADPPDEGEGGEPGRPGRG
jgi:hypothetical protein